MLTLAFDTSALTATVAVAEISGGSIGKYSLFSTRNKLKHSENLMEMVDSALKLFGATINEIELIAVSVGPGSFTGVRIGVATAKGIAFPKSLPCVGVSTLEAIAENSDKFGAVCPVLDARRGQFYNAIFENGVRLCEDRAISAEAIVSECAKYNRILVCGDGTDVFLNLVNSDKFVSAPIASRDQNALSVALCGHRAFERGEAHDAKTLSPVYLRNMVQ